MQPTKIDPVGYMLILTFLLLLTYCGYLANKSIDWTVLKRLESQQLVLPTPISSASATALSATPSAKPATK